MQRLPGFICRQKLGFCFHGDLEFQFYKAANCCLCFTSMFQKKGGLEGGREAGDSVTFPVKALELQQGCLDGVFWQF